MWKTSEDRAAYEQKVFLNVPYDEKYSDLFARMIACLIGLGFVPQCGLQTEGAGENRLHGIFKLLSSCSASIHDLSRMELWGDLTVPRFNMPFELGLAYALQSKGKRHRIFVFDEEARRAMIALSDMAGFDVKNHQGTSAGLLNQILNCFGPQTGTPSRQKLKELMNFVAETMREFQEE